MKIQFLGAAHRVTGSNYLLSTENDEQFFLDCGMFQGSKAEEALNARPWPLDVSQLPFMILTHAHIDHSGRIPLLIHRGFRGEIYCTKATADLAAIMLEDSARIQGSDAIWENKHRERRGEAPLEPLYTVDDVAETVQHLHPLAYGAVVELTPHIRLRLRDAGHILGSAIAELWIEEGGRVTKLVFSGDLGMSGHLLVRDPEKIEDADYVIMESTYGNTRHGSYEESLSEVTGIIEKVCGAGGTVVIPSFAVGRTQELVYELNNYYEGQGRRNPYPIYVDSPLARRATAVFAQNSEVFDTEAQAHIRGGDNIFRFPNLHYTQSSAESMALNENKEPKVIISASGMATAGRVRHHLKHTLYDPKNAVVFVGYQAEGSLGRIILEGRAEKIKIAGEWIALRAQVYDLEGFSAHADYPALLDWLRAFQHKPREVILVHGEDREMQPLSQRIAEQLGLKVRMPQENSVLELRGERSEEAVSAPVEAEQRSHVADTLAEVQQLMASWDEKAVDLEPLDEAGLSKAAAVLERLRGDLFELNMATGK